MVASSGACAAASRRLGGSLCFLTRESPAFGAARPILRRRFVLGSVRSFGAATSADDLQAWAARIVQDRSLAERLASSSLAPQLLDLAAHAAEASGEVASSSSSSSSSSPCPEPQATTAKDRLLTEAPLPTSRQMNIYFLQQFIPFIGFGFFDNFIMILAGDYIDSRLGVAFGISTMAAAAIGNTFSDVIGVQIAGVIETAGAAMGLPASGLTELQRCDIRMRILKNTGMVLGIVVGCMLGMAPLVYPQEWRLWPSREERIHTDLEDATVVGVV